MAISAATKMSDFSGFIPPERAGYIFERAARSSIVQQLCPRVPLGYSGTEIPYVTGRPTVTWLGEAEQKPQTSGSLALKTIVPKKIAAIFTVSEEVVRANPGNYVDIMRNQMADAFGIAFDRAALHDEGPDGSAGGGPFSTYVDQTTKAVELGTAAQADGGVYGDLVAAIAQIVADTDSLGRRFRLTGWALDDVAEPALLAATDTGGRPLFIDTPPAEVGPTIRGGRLIGRPAFMGEGVATLNQLDVVGYGGDFGTQAVWGAIGGINFSVSTESAVTINGSLVSLWENNLLAVRAEAEYGFLVNDTGAFVKLTNVGNVPVTSA